MERLTERLGDYTNPKEICAVWVKNHDYVSAAHRLADYEDIADTVGGFDRLRELADADKDGRLVALPSNKTLTNADRMRTATNQQLAKLLYDNQKEFCRLMYKKLGFEDELNFSEDYSDILAWLNAPSKEAEAALEAMKDGN